MTELSPWIYRTPKIFYSLAVIVFLVHFLTAYSVFVELERAIGGVDARTFQAMIPMILSGVTDAIWIVANGILFQILITFWVRYTSKDGNQSK